MSISYLVNISFDVIIMEDYQNKNSCLERGVGKKHATWVQIFWVHQKTHLKYSHTYIIKKIKCDKNEKINC